MEETPRNRPTLTEALQAIHSEDLPESLDVKTVHFTILATGDIPYRLHPSDGSDYVGGVARVTEFSANVSL